MVSSTIRSLILLIVVALLASCGSTQSYQPVPRSSGIDGVWIFLSENQDAQQLLARSISYSPLSRQAMSSLKKDISANEKAYDALRERRVVQDLMASQMGLTPQELFIKSEGKAVSIDFGVMGYFTFMTGKETEVLIAEVEVDAQAGWEPETRSLRVDFYPPAAVKVEQQFTLIESAILRQRVTIKLFNRQDPVILERLYRRKLQY